MITNHRNNYTNNNRKLKHCENYQNVTWNTKQTVDKVLSMDFLNVELPQVFNLRNTVSAK